MFAGELAGLAESDMEKIADQAVEGNGNGAHLERDHDYGEEDCAENCAMHEQSAERQGAQGQASI